MKVVCVSAWGDGRVRGVGGGGGGGGELVKVGADG